MREPKLSDLENLNSKDFEKAFLRAKQLVFILSSKFDNEKRTRLMENINVSLLLPLEYIKGNIESVIVHICGDTNPVAKIMLTPIRLSDLENYIDNNQLSFEPGSLAIISMADPEKGYAYEVGTYGITGRINIESEDSL